jgi:hypothetical protein
MARENFVQMGEMMIRFIYDVSHITPLANQLSLVEHEMARVSQFLHWYKQEQEDL